MDHQPTVWPIEWGELLEFCNSAGYRCRLEPSGSLLIPPDYNVGMTDWEKSLRLRKGEFSVLGAEPAPRQAAGEGFFLDGPNWVFESAAMQGEWWSHFPRDRGRHARLPRCNRFRQAAPTVLLRGGWLKVKFVGIWC
jgi:hypothetical protein